MGETREHYLVVRESDAENPNGSIHVKPTTQEGVARSEADARARSRPGIRYSVYRRVDTCEAHVLPAEWDEEAPDA